MTMHIRVSANYQHDPDTLFDRATHFDDLISATRKIARYDGLPQGKMVQGRTYDTDIGILGLTLCKGYRIHIRKICNTDRVMESSETHETVPVWAHRIMIDQTASGSRWTDEVFIDAGRKTALVARYAMFMYRLRHRERCGLIAGSTMQRSVRQLRPDLPYFQPAA